MDTGCHCRLDSNKMMIKLNRRWYRFSVVKNVYILYILFSCCFLCRPESNCTEASLAKLEWIYCYISDLFQSHYMRPNVIVFMFNVHTYIRILETWIANLALRYFDHFDVFILRFLLFHSLLRFIVLLIIMSSSRQPFAVTTSIHRINESTDSIWNKLQEHREFIAFNPCKSNIRLCTHTYFFIEFRRKW